MIIRRYPKILVLVLVLIAPVAFAEKTSISNEPLEIGIVPVFNAGTVFSFFKPLQHYLEQKLKRPILLITAPDHQTFVRRTQKGEHAIVFTSAHYARLAQKEARYIPLLRAKKYLSGAMVVRKDSNFYRVSALKGKVIAFPNFISMESFIGRSYLNSQRLSPGKDIHVRYFNSLSSALYAVNSGEADAAAAPVFALNFLPMEFRDQLKVIAATRQEISMMVLAHPGLSKSLSSKIVQSILDFANKTPEGKKFVELGDYAGFQVPTSGEMKRLDRFMPELKMMLKQTPSLMTKSSL